jgi:hypothetical protein
MFTLGGMSDARDTMPHPPDLISKIVAEYKADREQERRTEDLRSPLDKARAALDKLIPGVFDALSARCEPMEKRHWVQWSANGSTIEACTSGGVALWFEPDPQEDARRIHTAYQLREALAVMFPEG